LKNLQIDLINKNQSTMKSLKLIVTICVLATFTYGNVFGQNIKKAILKNDIEAVKTILNQGLELEKLHPAIDAAIYEGHQEIAILLIKSGPRYGKSSFSNDMREIMDYVNTGNEGGYSLKRYSPDYEVASSTTQTPLWMAAKKGQLDVVKALGESGALIDLTFNGSSPLSASVSFKHFAVAQYLIENGADVNLKIPEQGGYVVKYYTPLSTINKFYENPGTYDIKGKRYEELVELKNYLSSKSY
jgi:hypothetical protein